MKLIICFAILFFFHFTSIAQSTFDPGYIVTNSKDSVKGFVMNAQESELTLSVKFKQTLSSELKEYKPSDLAGFGIGTDIYRSKKFLNTAEDSVIETAFLKLLVKGQYTLYSYVKPARKFYLLNSQNHDYFLYDAVIGNAGEVIRVANYYNDLNFVSISCEKVNKLVKDVGFNDKSVSDFVWKLDNCESNPDAVDYYQKPKTVILPVIFAGGLPFAGQDQQFTANFTLRFTLPSLDKKTSLNIGLNYSFTNKNKSYGVDGDIIINVYTKEQIVSIPVTVQYNFTTSWIQPYFYLGASGAFVKTQPAPNDYGYYAPQPAQYFGFAVVAGLGVEARIVSRLYAKVDWRYELIIQFPAIGLSYHF
jgi:hypothetical protein